MSTDDDHFLRQRAAGDLTDHVVRGRGAIPTAVQRHLHRGRATGEQACQLVGVGHRQCRRRHRRQAVIEAGDAGMRHAVRIGTGRTHQEADRALADGLGRALAADRAAAAVVAAIAERQHLVIDEGDLALQRTGRRGLQRGQIGEAHDLGFHRAARAAAQRGDLQRLRVPAGHGGVFTAALPLREGHRFLPHLVKAQGLELGFGPGHGTGVGLAAGDARADLGGQRFDHLPAGVIGQCLVAQLRGGGQRGRRQGGGMRRREGRRGQQGEGGCDGKDAATHGQLREGCKPWSLTVVQRRAWAGGHGRCGCCFPAMNSKAKAPPERGFRVSCRAGPMLGCRFQISRAWARLYRRRGRQRRPTPYFFRLSRISRSSTTSSAGAAGAASCLRDRRLITLITRKMAKATITNWISVLMKSP
ncbi:hypothetical protein D3C81_745380 [compost metagenome]